MFLPGDIVKAFAPTAGYFKYHLCLDDVALCEVSRFMWLNSDPSFDGTYDVSCARVPCLPTSATNMTCFSFSVLPRFTVKQLEIYEATKLGVIDRTLAGELANFANIISNLDGLNGKERKFLRQALHKLK